MIFNFSEQKFNNAINNAKEAYDELNKKYEALENRYNNLDAQKEIKQMQQKIWNIYNHALVIFTDKELKAERAFRDKHYNKHPKKMALSTYIYTISGTGIGNIIKIKCPICGEEEDITDSDSW